jgi:hypothetical protein
MSESCRDPTLSGLDGALANPRDWRNIQDIVSKTFHLMHEAMGAQARQIRSLQDEVQLLRHRVRCLSLGGGLKLYKAEQPCTGQGDISLQGTTARASRADEESAAF